MPSGSRIRLDRLLVQRGLVESGEKARALIMAGLVEVEPSVYGPASPGRTGPVKPGTLVKETAKIILREKNPPYVSRGGVKLEAALEYFSVDVKGLELLDVGASTGGFTDCLLKKGASKVIAIDVGYGQLDWRLRSDPRVEVLEKTNVRHLKPEHIKAPVHGAVIDVSFISLRLVVPVVSTLLQGNSFIIALVKPQFEVGKGRVGRRGVVRDPELHNEVIEGLSTLFITMGWTVRGYIPSPLLGPKGNKEFLTYLTRKTR